MHRLTGHKSEPAGFCLKYAIGNRPVFGLFSADFSGSAPACTDYIVIIRYHVICVEVFRNLCAGHGQPFSTGSAELHV